MYWGDLLTFFQELLFLRDFFSIPPEVRQEIDESQAEQLELVLCGEILQD